MYHTKPRQYLPDIVFAMSFLYLTEDKRYLKNCEDLKRIDFCI